MAIRFPDNLTGKADWTPRVIPDGQTFRVPAGKQVLFAEQIELEGDAVIDVEGDLVEVS